MEEDIKSIGWKYVDHCGNCGSCGGGKHKIVFGKSFERVCGCTFRVDNPTESDIPFLKIGHEAFIVRINFCGLEKLL